MRTTMCNPGQIVMDIEESDVLVTLRKWIKTEDGGKWLEQRHIIDKPSDVSVIIEAAFEPCLQHAQLDYLPDPVTGETDDE